jgi:ribose 5-phosphate isomerase B
MPGRFIDNNTAKQIMDEFFKTSFEGGRHQKRVEKIPVQK